MARGDGARALWWLAVASALSASAPVPLAAPASGGSQAPTLVAPVRPGLGAQDASGRILVWIDLDLPELATVPRDRPAEREALRAMILEQQQDVMGRLQELGAIEQARVQQVRNALAVRLPGAQMATARRLPGVRGVRIVRIVDRPAADPAP